MRRLLDIWDPAAQRALSRAMDEGQITFAELAALLPATDDVTIDEIEAALEQLVAMGITPYEVEEPESGWDIALPDLSTP